MSAANDSIGLRLGGGGPAITAAAHESFGQPVLWFTAQAVATLLASDGIYGNIFRVSPPARSATPTLCRKEDC